MAKVPLRLYNREIENLIDHKQTEEAAAHCRHILQIFPKHIDTYRLLGKSYLESQHYAEASDIFQRVISVIPDDFVSHVGLSIIREDEGNLDESIWHMERAFEVAPANAAVQEELRRRYTRRDGVEPPKVRLTRAALVRMYANGFLYDQAITEINNALAEEPDRADLQVMLARMYLANGQKIEATEVCSKLLEKFPYCWSANQILSEILTANSRSEDAQSYQQRMVAIDPYAAYLSPVYSSTIEVPDTMVQVDRLEWDASTEVASEKPGWAESLGLKIDESLPLDIPDWLNPNQSVKSEGAVQVFDSPLQILQAGKAPQGLTSEPTPAFKTPEFSNQPGDAPESTIPDWMRDAGWFSGQASQAVSSSGFEDEPGSESSPDLSDIVPADIPDWVRSMAPPVSQQEAINPEPPAEAPRKPIKETPAAPLPDWLSSIIDHPEETPAASVEGAHTEVPDWLKNLETTEAAPSAPQLPQAEEVTPAGEEIPARVESATPAEPVDAALASWLQDVEETALAEPVEAVAEQTTEDVFPEPELAAETLETGQIDEQEDITAQAEVISMPSWLDSYEEEPLEDQPAVVIPTWLEGIRVEGTEPEEDTFTSQPSSWFDEAAAASDLAAQVQSWEEVKPGFVERVQQEELESVAAEETPSYTDQATSEVVSLDETASPVFEMEEEPLVSEVTETPADELPDWLRAIESEQVEKVESPTAEVTPIEEAAAELEEELIVESVADLQPVETLTPTEETPAETPAAEAAPPADETTIAWLEDLAETHSSEAKTLIIRKSNRNIQPPEWVREEPAVPEPAADETINPFPAAAAGSTQSENAALEAWLKELESEQQLKSPDAFVNKREPVPKNTAALRMWLDNLLEESPDETPVASPPEVESPIGIADIDQGEWVSEAELPDQEFPSDVAPDAISDETLVEKASELPEAIESPIEVTSEVSSFEALETINPEVVEPAEESFDLKPSEELLSVEPAVVDEVEPETEPIDAVQDLIEAETAELLDQPVARSELVEEVPVEDLPVQAEPSFTEAEVTLSKVDTPPEASGVMEEVVESVDTGDRDLEPVVEEMTPVEGIEPESEAAAEPFEAAPEQIAEVMEGTAPVEIPEPAASLESIELEELEFESVPEVATVEPIQDEIIPEAAVSESIQDPAVLEESHVADAEAEQPLPEVEIPDWLRSIVAEEEARAAGIESPVNPDSPKVFEVSTEETPEPIFEIPEASIQEEAEQIVTPDLSTEPVVPTGTGSLGQGQDWSLLQMAEKNLWGGEVDTSLNQYARLIKSEHYLEETIRDLKDALYQRPLDIGIWETLGDAYARNNCLQDALDAYTKAEELLR